jgi:hypothetical protein
VDIPLPSLAPPHAPPGADPLEGCLGDWTGAIGKGEDRATILYPGSSRSQPRTHKRSSGAGGVGFS